MNKRLDNPSHYSSSLLSLTPSLLPLCFSLPDTVQCMTDCPVNDSKKFGVIYQLNRVLYVYNGAYCILKTGDCSSLKLIKRQCQYFNFNKGYKKLNNVNLKWSLADYV